RWLSSAGRSQHARRGLRGALSWGSVKPFGPPQKDAPPPPPPPKRPCQGRNNLRRSLVRRSPTPFPSSSLQSPVCLRRCASRPRRTATVVEHTRSNRDDLRDKI